MSKTGITEFCAQLDKIVAEVAKAEYVKDAGQFVRSAAILNAPALSGYLRDNIFADFEGTDDGVKSAVYTNVSYAPYVELGTGPKGAVDHGGISPNVTPVYRMTPWWIHESDIDKPLAEMYHWPFIDTPEGRFYKCSGQPARPFMYPALKDNENKVMDILKCGMNEVFKGAKK